VSARSMAVRAPSVEAMATPAPIPVSGTALPGMPTVTDPHNVYAAAGTGVLSEAACAAKPLVYVPHTTSRDVWVIDPSTFVVVARYPVGTGELQHVVPSWDLHTLYATDDKGDRLTPFDPATGTPGKPIPVTDPYNLYFTPDGRSAVSVAEAHRELVFHDPRTGAGHAADAGLRGHRPRRLHR
jgi:DNA-binding beta-propeller fold protein YncE